MAALVDQAPAAGPPADVVDLRHLPAADLEQLLQQEVHLWERQYKWDFRPSADLIQRYVHMQSLQGFALRAGGAIVGYCYQVSEDRKGVIGDFYVAPGRHAVEHEYLLLSAVVQSLMHTAGVRRIESQLMLLRLGPGAVLPFSRFLSRHERCFLEVEASAIAALAHQTLSLRAHLQHWSDRMQDEVAHLISSAYRGHVDSEINDQYRSISGARRFLTNIIRYPGCGRFCKGASFVALDEGSGRVCGVCLASKIAANAGHITQVCVLPAMRGSKMGYELLRASLQQLVAEGVATVSLTVTASNAGAIRLYDSVGFRNVASFPALVWEQF